MADKLTWSQQTSRGRVTYDVEVTLACYLKVGDQLLDADAPERSTYVGTVTAHHDLSNVIDVRWQKWETESYDGYVAKTNRVWKATRRR